MLAIERRNEILEKLQNEKKVIVSDLSRHYNVSEETIRRDLEKLESEGLAVKSYGGAVLNEQNILELPINIRKNQCVYEKTKIAELAAEMVSDGETIMMDASSTAVYVANELKEKKELTVITNSVELLAGLLGVKGWNVISTGGTLREKSFSLTGSYANQAIKRYRVDKAFVSCKGLDITQGITDFDEEDAYSKRLMLEAASEKILIADSSKFDTVAFAEVVGLDNFTKIITDKKPADKWIKIFKQHGVECIYPE